MKIIDCVQGSEEWLRARSGIATASNFATILSNGRGKEEAVGRVNYRARLVVERLTGRPVETYFGKAMVQGVEREPIARSVYESRTRTIVDSVGLLRHDEIAAGASPDGLIDEDGCLEIKCPELSAHLEYLRLPPDTAPRKYVPQIQGELWISGRAWCDFVSFNSDFPEHLQLVVRRIARDDKAIAQLEFMVRAFLDEVCIEEEAVRRLAA